MQGSGWGVLAWEPLGRRLVVEQVYDHHGNVGMNTTPLLVFDAWEHAYYLQYRNVRPDYVEKLWAPDQLERRHRPLRPRPRAPDPMTAAPAVRPSFR